MAEGARITIYAQLQFRHDVEANWLAADPILKVGEPAYTIGYSDRFKLGDGQSKWSELPYLQFVKGGGGGGSQAYESLAWSAIKTLTSGDASVLAQAYAVKQAYTELKSLIPNLADYYTKEQINALIPSLEGYATEDYVKTSIANLINGAPTTLDTLKEIADAFAQSQDVIEALDEAIGKKANQSDLTALAARVAANEGNITSLSSNKLDKSIWDSVFEIDEKGNLRAKVGIYSTSFISARTSDPSAGGGGEGGGGAFSLYTWDQVKAMTAEVGGVAPTAYALKQAYNELINATPTLSWNSIQDKPIFANVATSGSYSDLIGRPTSLSDLANDVGYITSSAIPSTYAWSAITGKPTTLSGYGITDAVALQGATNVLMSHGNEFNFASAAYSGQVFINWRTGSTLLDGNISEYNFLRGAGRTYAALVAGSYVVYGGTSSQFLKADGSLDSTGYLPLSGGTISGTNYQPLVVNSTWSGNSQDVRIALSHAGAIKGLINWNSTEGFRLYNNITGASLGIKNDGMPFYNSYTLIHSGNIGSYAFIPRDAISSNTDANNLQNGVYLNGTGNGTGNSNFPQTYSIISHFTQSDRYQSQISIGNPNVYVRRKIDTWSEWVELITNKNIGERALNISGTNARPTLLTPYENLNDYGYGYYSYVNANDPENGYGTNAALFAFRSYRGNDTWQIAFDGNGINNTAGPNFAIRGNFANIGWTVWYRIATTSSNVASAQALITSSGDELVNVNADGLLFLGGREAKWATVIDGTSIHLRTKNYAYGLCVGETGNVLIGTTTDNGAKLQVNGNITASGTIYSAVGMYSPGYISARSTAGSSDRNLKTNVAPVRNALAYILGTKYVSFDWKDTGEHSVGIIAQDELNREWSCLVQKYSEHYSYQYTQHTALIGSALQEEDKKVEALKAEVVALKAEVQQLRNERQLWQQ